MTHEKQKDFPMGSKWPKHCSSIALRLGTLKVRENCRRAIKRPAQYDTEVMIYPFKTSLKVEFSSPSPHQGMKAKAGGTLSQIQEKRDASLLLHHFPPGRTSWPFSERRNFSTEDCTLIFQQCFFPRWLWQTNLNHIKIVNFWNAIIFKKL